MWYIEMLKLRVFSFGHCIYIYVSRHLRDSLIAGIIQDRFHSWTVVETIIEVH